MKIKRLFRLFFAMLFVFAMTFAYTTAAYAAASSKTVSSSKSMSVILKEGSSGDSNIISFRVSGLPANATVTKIEVNTGSLSFKGAVLTNKLILTSSNKATEASVAWNGASNSKLTFKTQFYNTPANGTYDIRFNATCLGGYIERGIKLDTGTKTYSRPSITIYYEY
ncbi:hypothetical protein [Clostridium sp. Marseille-P2415]|uniref:hypothetical protein n=1 Tax=Clostridium sp. Marseille-P2415 TaxID=1805471 RepID=UPI0009885993|nr:hypothetical protein [Clostridium sp. Marseille-P2415]